MQNINELPGVIVSHEQGFIFFSYTVIRSQSGAQCHYYVCATILQYYSKGTQRKAQEEEI